MANSVGSLNYIVYVDLCKSVCVCLARRVLSQLLCIHYDEL